MVVRRRSTNQARHVRTRSGAEIVGFSGLFEQLTTNLPKATQAAVLRRAGKAAMQPVMDRIEESAPERSGQTKASVRMIARLLKATAHFGSAIRIQIGVGTKGVFWPRFSEFGTIHEPARPFIRPVFDGERVEVIARLKIMLQSEIVKAIARRAKRLSKGK